MTQAFSADYVGIPPVVGVIGTTQVWMGTETRTWNDAQFHAAAQATHDMGVDSVLLKAGDGTMLWYGGLGGGPADPHDQGGQGAPLNPVLKKAEQARYMSPAEVKAAVAGYKARRDIFRAHGVGCSPYFYLYGNHYGAYLPTELAHVKQYLQSEGVVCLDLEAEWNGQVEWARTLNATLKGASGALLLSTWANPWQQSWTDVAKAMDPCVDLWMPQAYTNYLWSQYSRWQSTLGVSAARLNISLMMTQDFGPNDQPKIAREAGERGCVGVSLWHHATANANLPLTQTVLTEYEKGAPPVIIETPLSIQEAGAWFIQVSESRWQAKDEQGQPAKDEDGNPLLVRDGILVFLRAGRSSVATMAMFTHTGKPRTNEYPVGPHGETEQVFERCRVRWDPGKKLDNPPGAVNCYLTHLEQVFDAAAHLPAVTTALNAAKTLIKDREASLAQCAADLSRTKGDLTTTQAALAACEQKAYGEAVTDVKKRLSILPDIPPPTPPPPAGNGGTTP